MQKPLCALSQSITQDKSNSTKSRRLMQSIVALLPDKKGFHASSLTIPTLTLSMTMKPFLPCGMPHAADILEIFRRYEGCPRRLDVE